MNILTILILFFLFLLQYLKEKRIFSLPVFFHFFWFIIVFLYSFRFYGLYKVNDLIFYILIIGNVAFFIGVKLSSTLFRQYRLPKKRSYKANKIFYILLTLSFIIAFMKIYKMLPVIISEGIGVARNKMQVDDALNLSGLLSVFLAYFAKPFLRITLIYHLVEAFQNKITKEKLFSTLCIAMVTFYIDGGRTSIIYCFITIIYLYQMYYKYLSIRYKRYIISAIVIIVSMIAYYTLARNVNILENMYTYYCGSLVYFSENLDKAYLFDLHHSFGITSIQGILRPVFGVLNLIGIQDISSLSLANDFLMGVQTTVTPISDTATMNYFITAFGYAYSDFKHIGVFVIFLITGFVCDKVEKNPNDERGLCLKILYLQGICFTMSKYMFGDYNFFMSLIYLYLIDSSAKIKFRLKK